MNPHNGRQVSVHSSLSLRVTWGNTPQQNGEQKATGYTYSYGCRAWHRCRLSNPWWVRGEGICLQCARPGFDPWVGKIPWRRKRQPTPAPLPGESHGRRSLWAVAHRVAKSQTRLSDFTSLSWLQQTSRFFPNIHRAYVELNCALNPKESLSTGGGAEQPMRRGRGRPAGPEPPRSSRKSPQSREKTQVAKQPMGKIIH